MKSMYRYGDWPWPQLNVMILRTPAAFLFWTGWQVPMDVLGLLNNERSLYARQWHVSAKHLEKNGYYRWMASWLTGYQRILDIGIGTGQGVLALLERGHVVVGIEENPVCLGIAKTRLTNAGKNVVCETRGRAVVSAPESYSIQYCPPRSSTPAYGALLMEGDVLHDDPLIEWLMKHGLFDGVTCWCVGTHGGRPSHDVVKKRSVSTSGEYRLVVQNAIYELADKMLRPGGILQVVDRQEEPSKDYLREDVLRAHREQASVTSLCVEGLEYLAYRDADSAGKVQLCLTPGAERRVPDTLHPALVSVISRKP